jgi:hypothetical protein
MIDLRTCKAGDKLLSKHGMVLTYVGPLPEGSYMDHEVQYPNGGTKGQRTHDGFTYRVRRMPEDHDIVEILPKTSTDNEGIEPLTDEEIEAMDKVLEASKDEGTEAQTDSTLDEGMELLKHEGTEVSKDEGTKPWSATVFLEDIGRFSTLKEAAHASFKIIDERLKAKQPYHGWPSILRSGLKM